MTPCSPPSRRGLATAERATRAERRPTLTASARGISAPAGRDEETACGRTKKRESRSCLRLRYWLGRTCLRGPWRTTSHDRVGEDEQLSGAGNEGNLVQLAGARQPAIKRNQLRIPPEGGGQRCRIEGATQALAPACDVTHARIGPAVIVVGCHAGKGRGLLARDLPDLGHAHQDGDRGWQSDPIDAVDQIEPPSEVVMLPDRRHQRLELGLL